MLSVLQPSDPTPPDAPRVFLGRVCRMGDDERSFDDDFWRAISPHQRVEMLWDMVKDALAVKGIHDEPRLQRTVGHLRRP